MKTNQGIHTDHDWLSRWSEGDKTAFEQVYHQFYQPVCYFAYRFTQDMPQAEDIASVVLAKVWERRTDFSDPAAVKAFLYVSARNASLDYLKSQKVRSGAAGELRYQALLSDDAAMAGQLEAQLLKHIYDAVESLPPRAKEIFRMIYIEGLSTEAIAAKLQLPVQTVRNNKARALELLRVQLLKKDILPLWFILHFF